MRLTNISSFNSFDSAPDSCSIIKTHWSHICSNFSSFQYSYDLFKCNTNNFTNHTSNKNSNIRETKCKPHNSTYSTYNFSNKNTNIPISNSNHFTNHNPNISTFTKTNISAITIAHIPTISNSNHFTNHNTNISTFTNTNITTFCNSDKTG